VTPEKGRRGSLPPAPVQVDSSPARLAAQMASPRRTPRPQHGAPNHFSWLYEEAVEHYSAVALLYDLCAEDGQRRFGKEPHAGFPRNFEYRWVEDGSSQAQSVSSPEYVREVLHWTEKVLGDPELEAGRFPRRFVSLMSTIFTRLFRVYAIMLHQHAEVLENHGALVHLRLAFEGFMTFALENDLVREKEFRVLQPEVDAVLCEFERGEAEKTLPSRPYSSSQTTLWNEQVTEEATLSRGRLPVAATSPSAGGGLMTASPPRRGGSVQRMRGAPSAPAGAPPSASAPLSPLSSGSSQNAEPAPSPPSTAGAGKASFRKSVSSSALRLRSALLESLSPSKLLRRGRSRGRNPADAATSQSSPRSRGGGAGFAASAADTSYDSGSSSSLLELRSTASLESFASLTSASSGGLSPSSALSPPSLGGGGSGGSAFFETGRSRSSGLRAHGVHFTAEEQVQRMSHLETLPAGLPTVEVEQMLTRVIESAHSKEARACVVAVRNMIQAEIRFSDLVLKLHDEYVVPARSQARLPEATLDDMFGNVSEVRRLSEHLCSEMHRAMQPLLTRDTAMRSMAFSNGAALARVPTEVSPAMVVRAICERGVLPNLGLFPLVYARNVAFYSEALEHINNAVARNNAFARIVQSKNAKLNTSLPALLEAVRGRPFEFAAQLAELSAAVYQAFHLPQFPQLARLRTKQQPSPQQQQQQQQQMEQVAQARGLTLTSSASSATSGASSASDASGEAESPESPSSQGARRGARREKREKRALRRLVVQTANAALAKARAVSDAAQLLRDEAALQALRPGKPALAAGVAAVKSSREGAAGLTDRWANFVVVVFEDCVVLAARPPSPKTAPGRALKRLTSSASMSSVLSASSEEASPTNARARQQRSPSASEGSGASGARPSASLLSRGLSRLRFKGLVYRKPAALAAGVAALMEEGVVMDGGLESGLVVENVLSMPVISDRRAAQALAAKGRVSLSFKCVDKAGAPRTVQLAGCTLDLAAAIFDIAGQASLPAGLRSDLLRQDTEDSRISNAFFGFAKPKQQQQQQQEQQQQLLQQKPAPRRTVDVVVTRGAGHAAATLAMHAYFDCHKRALRAWMPEAAPADPAAATQDAALAMHESRYLIVVLAPEQLERQLRHPALAADLAAAGKTAKPVVLLALDRDSPGYEDHDIDRAILTLPEPARAVLKRAVRARYPVLPHAQAGLWAQLEADLADRDAPVSPTELSSAGSGARQRRPRLSADSFTRAPVDAVTVQ
jgi:MOB kinase activator 1